MTAMTGMSRKIVAAVASVVAVTAASGCDSAPPVPANPRQVTVVGSGEVQGVPDTLTADVAVESVAPDVTAAIRADNESMRNAVVMTDDKVLDCYNKLEELQKEYDQLDYQITSWLEDVYKYRNLLGSLDNISKLRIAELRTNPSV